MGRRAALGVRPFWRGRHRSEYRRTIRHLLNRGETRNSLARDVFHGHRAGYAVVLDRLVRDFGADGNVALLDPDRVAGCFMINSPPSPSTDRG